ncbi:MAG: 4Fe-4S binding protein [Planctomycetaceae bacterium]|jgi:electron transport protein HydN|nr:4Fe-4S binding protein [Planctomycetaceae bacterium]
MIVVEQNKCVGCRTCVYSCPIGAVDLIKLTTENGEVSSIAMIDPTVCGICGVCIDRCPKRAVSLQDDKKINESNLVS